MTEEANPQRRRQVTMGVLGAVVAALVVVVAIPYVVHVEHPALAASHDSTAVDAALVAAGRAVFHGAGTCAMCHGAQLQGGVGPTLRDHPWKDAKGGTLDAIYGVITHGVPGTAMPKNPGGIDDVKAHQVAAYVYAVSHGAAKP